MIVSGKKSVKLADGSLLFRYNCDGKGDAAGANQLITPIEVFPWKNAGSIIMLDEFWVGIDYQRDSGVEMFSLGLHIFLKDIAKVEVVDSMKPDYRENFPLGFNLNSGGEYAKMTMKPYLWIEKGETGVICLEGSPNVGAPMSTFKPFTIMFRYRELEAAY